MKSKKYKKVLKSCKGPKCKRLCFIKEGDEIKYYCAVYGDYYMSNCKRKKNLMEK